MDPLFVTNWQELDDSILLHFSFCRVAPNNKLDLILLAFQPLRSAIHFETLELINLIKIILQAQDLDLFKEALY